MRFATAQHGSVVKSTLEREFRLEMTQDGIVDVGICAGRAQKLRMGCDLTTKYSSCVKAPCSRILAWENCSTAGRNFVLCAWVP